jgi:hypothetical protein
MRMPLNVISVAIVERKKENINNLVGIPVAEHENTQFLNQVIPGIYLTGSPLMSCQMPIGQQIRKIQQH